MLEVILLVVRRGERSYWVDELLYFLMDLAHQRLEALKMQQSLRLALKE